MFVSVFLLALERLIFPRVCVCVSACAGEADIAFVLDASGSVRYQDWLKVIAFVQKVITDMFIANEGVNVAIVTYGGHSNRLMCFKE